MRRPDVQIIAEKPNMADVLLDGLIAYAIERQGGFEQHESEPEHPRAERRKEWIQGILRSLADLGWTNDPEKMIVEFSERLEMSAGCFAAEPASGIVQRDTVTALKRCASELALSKDDRRHQLMQIKELLEDMTAWLPLDARNIGIYPAREQVELDLRRLTARQPIRFTRILLGPERGPCESDLVPGTVTTVEAVRKTEFFQSFAKRYPEVSPCPSLCVVYGGCVGRAVRDASALDMTIIREVGDRFLDEPGIRNLSGLYEMRISLLGEGKTVPSCGRNKNKGGQER